MTNDIERLIRAASAVLEMCEQHGDFRNGVTDPTGTVDEGNVVASQYLENLRTALAAPGAAIDAREQSVDKTANVQGSLVDKSGNLQGVDAREQEGDPWGATIQHLCSLPHADFLEEAKKILKIDGPLASREKAPAASAQGFRTRLPTMPDLRYHPEYRRGFASCLDEFKRMRAAALYRAATSEALSPATVAQPVDYLRDAGDGVHEFVGKHERGAFPVYRAAQPCASQGCATDKSGGAE